MEGDEMIKSSESISRSQAFSKNMGITSTVAELACKF